MRKGSKQTAGGMLLAAGIISVLLLESQTEAAEEALLYLETEADASIYLEVNTGDEAETEAFLTLSDEIVPELIEDEGSGAVEKAALFSLVSADPGSEDDAPYQSWENVSYSNSEDDSQMFGTMDFWERHSTAAEDCSYYPGYAVYGDRPLEMEAVFEANTKAASFAWSICPEFGEWVDLADLAVEIESVPDEDADYAWWSTCSFPLESLQSLLDAHAEEGVQKILFHCDVTDEAGNIYPMDDFLLMLVHGGEKDPYSYELRDMIEWGNMAEYYECRAPLDGASGEVYCRFIPQYTGTYLLFETGWADQSAEGIMHYPSISITSSSGELLVQEPEQRLPIAEDHMIDFQVTAAEEYLVRFSMEPYLNNPESGEEAEFGYWNGEDREAILTSIEYGTSVWYRKNQFERLLFTNSRLDFSYLSSYRFPLKTFEAVWGKQVDESGASIAESLYSVQGEWGGNCFGMSAVIGLFGDQNSGITLQDFGIASGDTLDLTPDSYSARLGMTFREFIEMLQVMQYRRELNAIGSQLGIFQKNMYMPGGTNSNNALSSLCGRLKQTAAEPCIIGVFHRTSETEAFQGHYVLGYAYEDADDREGRIQITDGNYSGIGWKAAARFMTIQYGAGKTPVGWTYQQDGEVYSYASKDILAFLPISELSALVQKVFDERKSEKAEREENPSKPDFFLHMNAGSVKLKKGQSTNGLHVEMAAGDSIQSVVANKKKIVSASIRDAKNGEIRLKGKKTGKAKVTITLASGLTAVVTVRVQRAAVKTTGIMLAVPTTVTLKAGQQLSIGAEVVPFTSKQKLTYSSSKKKVASVSRKGVITAKKPGRAKITVRSGKKKKVVTVIVN